MVPSMGQRSMPVLQVADMDEATAFYCDKVGFKLANVWEHEGTKVFGIIVLDTVSVGLQVHAEPGTGDVWHSYIYVSNIDEFYQEITRRGAVVDAAPQDAVYGCRELEIVDPFGNRLCFGQDLSPGPLGPGL
ncbi:MAG: glyoxalase superfamily protein [Pseudomonadota bacterium]